MKTAAFFCPLIFRCRGDFMLMNELKLGKGQCSMSSLLLLNSPNRNHWQIIRTQMNQRIRAIYPCIVPNSVHIQIHIQLPSNKFVSFDKRSWTVNTYTKNLTEIWNQRLPLFRWLEATSELDDSRTLPCKSVVFCYAFWLWCIVTESLKNTHITTWGKYQY